MIKDDANVKFADVFFRTCITDASVFLRAKDNVIAMELENRMSAAEGRAQYNRSVQPHTFDETLSHGLYHRLEAFRDHFRKSGQGENAPVALCNLRQDVGNTGFG